MITRKQRLTETIVITKGSQKLTLCREDNSIVSAEAQFVPFTGASFLSIQGVAGVQDIVDMADILNIAVAEIKKYSMVEVGHE